MTPEKVLTRAKGINRSKYIDNLRASEIPRNEAYTLVRRSDEG